MQVIRLEELKNYSPEIITEFLLPAGTGELHLDLYKTHSETWYNLEGIFWNYTIAAWAGRLLGDCSEQISCTAPEAGDKLIPFSFTLRYANRQELAVILYKITTGIYGNKKQVLKFHALASYHFEQAWYQKQNSPLKPLLVIANKYLEQLM